MKQTILLLLVTFVISSLLNCLSYTRQALLVGTLENGALVTSHIVPVEFNVENDVLGTKKGSACAKSFLSLVALGDNSVQAAAKSAGITRIATVDSKRFGILNYINLGLIYGEICTEVTGE